MSVLAEVLLLFLVLISCFAHKSIGLKGFMFRGGNQNFGNHKDVAESPKSFLVSHDANTEVIRRKFEEICRQAQEKICRELELLDGEGKFLTESWIRENGGGGITKVMSGGKVFEKAGVNLSVVYGTMPAEALAAATKRGIDRAKGMLPGETVPFFACGVSSVIHPKNPHIPTLHFNYRYFETDSGHWWFGGGADITPSYLDEQDITHFHQTLKSMCDLTDPLFYPRFKQWADEYFVIPHRNETRGLGGIFFDDLNDRPPQELLQFAQAGLQAVVPAYSPIVQRHKSDAFTEQEKRWQQIRRGRYVEFNVMYDRGTVFGLKTGGRIESILMSLPETARWEYSHVAQPGSREEEIMRLFKHPRKWLH